MRNDHIVLAGGGHAHALLLKRWIMMPGLKPGGLITLVSRYGALLYSGMLPGLIAGNYHREKLEIDLHYLCNKAGVAFVLAEIIGIDVHKNLLHLSDRASIAFDQLSIDVGSETYKKGQPILDKKLFVAIKPLEKTLAWLSLQDDKTFCEGEIPLKIIGAGISGIEVSLALRKRWPRRKLWLVAKANFLNQKFKRILNDENIDIFDINASLDLDVPTLYCTGNRAPDWLADSGLPVNFLGRVRTSRTLQVIGFPHLFAVGDCAIVDEEPRPASGVWAVKAAVFLAKNLERSSRSLPLVKWSPQLNALQLIGIHFIDRKSSAWAVFGKLILGPSPFFWFLKELIDQHFMDGFHQLFVMNNIDDPKMLCRGCAAKIPEKVLKNSLKNSGFESLANKPKDSVELATLVNGDTLLQSVDGFPSIISDPWVNARIAALHACSDLWACGSMPKSAQALITLPLVNSSLQEQLLSQTLAGIHSALDPQGAKLIGGHTQEARDTSPEPCTLGISIGLTVNGSLAKYQKYWSKDGLKPGDSLFLSRSLGTGVMFAAAMRGGVLASYFDKAISQMISSQHHLVEQLILERSLNISRPVIHSCTDITGFGLLGHLGEMLDSTNNLRKETMLPPLRIILDLCSIPALPGTLELFKQGFASTLAPENKYSYRYLDPCYKSMPLVDLNIEGLREGSPDHLSLLNLIIDPQTCGPLLIACPKGFSAQLVESKIWIKIGSVEQF